MDKMEKSKKDRPYPELSLDERIRAIIEEVAAGNSPIKACKKYGQDYSDFKKACRDVDKPYAPLYARARLSSAEAQFEAIEDMEEQALDGTLDSNTLRAVTQSRQWRLSKINRHIYGDKIDHVSSDGSMSQTPIVDLSGRSNDEIKDLIGAAFKKGE